MELPRAISFLVFNFRSVIRCFPSYHISCICVFTPDSWWLTMEIMWQQVYIQISSTIVSLDADHNMALIWTVSSKLSIFFYMPWTWTSGVHSFNFFFFYKWILKFSYSTAAFTFKLNVCLTSLLSFPSLSLFSFSRLCVCVFVSLSSSTFSLSFSHVFCLYSFNLFSYSLYVQNYLFGAFHLCCWDLSI